MNDWIYTVYRWVIFHQAREECLTFEQCSISTSKFICTYICSPDFGLTIDAPGRNLREAFFTGLLFKKHVLFCTLNLTLFAFVTCVCSEINGSYWKPGIWILLGVYWLVAICYGFSVSGDSEQVFREFFLLFCFEVL